MSDKEARRRKSSVVQYPILSPNRKLSRVSLGILRRHGPGTGDLRWLAPKPAGKTGESPPECITGIGVRKSIRRSFTKTNGRPLINRHTIEYRHLDKHLQVEASHKRIGRIGRVSGTRIARKDVTVQNPPVQTQKPRIAMQTAANTGRGREGQLEESITHSPGLPVFGIATVISPQGRLFVPTLFPVAANKRKKTSSSRCLCVSLLLF